jgi:hypothetical protein
MYVCRYFVCAYVRTYIHIYVCMCVHVRMYVCVCMYVSTYACVCVHICMYGCVCVYVHTYACVCVCVCMHVWMNEWSVVVDAKLCQRWPNSWLWPFFCLYQNLFATSVISISSSLDRIFGSAYLQEEASSQTNIIKSRYCSRLTNEHTKYSLEMCQGNDEPYFNKFATYAMSSINFVIRLMKSTH